MTPETEALIAKSRRSLVASQRHLAQGDHDFAVSRAYYAMFYIAEAMLLIRELSYSKHSGVLAGFHQEFIRSGEFPRDCYAAFQRAYEARNVADYDYAIFPADRAKSVVEAAGYFLDQAEAYLRRLEAG